MKSDNWIEVSELGEEIVRLLNARKHLSATEKLIAICQAFGDITNAHDCELCRELVAPVANSLLVDDLIAAVEKGH
jgi:hypothetical protein